jgi:hypothetical protein
MYMQLNEKDKAMDYLEKSAEKHEHQLLTVKVEPIFEPLWTEVRFKNLLKKITPKQ